jgi:glutamate dehydrogenase (NAD(P)+)
VEQKADAQAVVRRHAESLGFTQPQIQQALTPTMRYEGAFRVKAADGTVVEFPWYRVGFAENAQANTQRPVDRDPTGRVLRQETNKGGVRLHFGVFAEEVEALALKMDLKLAVSAEAYEGQAFRGAKGGIGAGRVVQVGSRYAAKVGDYVDPASPAFDRGEIMRRFGEDYQRVAGRVGLGTDIQAGDVNTKAPEMKVLAEQAYGTPANPSSGVSGKEVRRLADGSIDPTGGIQFRAVSTGVGVWTSARLAADRVGLKLRGATVVSQGWGEVGRAFGMAAEDAGARVIAIQEVWNVDGAKVTGTLLHPKGADATPKEVAAWLADVDALRASGESLKTFQGARLAPYFHEGMDASAVKADIIGVNALGGTINEQTIPAYLQSGTHQGLRKILVEGANLAETAKAAALLDTHRAGILAVPGDLANVGGVHVSNLEAAQNVRGRPITDEQARRSLSRSMGTAWRRAVVDADTRGVSERHAIEQLGVARLMERSLHVAAPAPLNAAGPAKVAGPPPAAPRAPAVVGARP